MNLLTFGLIACAANAALPPSFLSYNATLVNVTRARIAAGDAPTLAALQSLLASADALIASSNISDWTVTAGPVAPSGDPHDYISASRYYWPCNVNVTGAAPPPPPPNTTCNETTGLPWVMHDGIVNWAALELYDSPRLGNFSAAFILWSQAYFWSLNESYATLAAHVFRTWFLLPNTGMNPNMNFAQAVPGLDNGSWWGIIEMDQFLPIMDGLLMIAPSPSWGDNDTAALSTWLLQWEAWLHSSPLAIQESQATNNHHTYFNMLGMTTALWNGNVTWANALVEDAKSGPNAPITVQIWADGELPQEEARTNSMGYVTMDLSGLFALGALSRSLAAPGEAGDLYSYVSPNASSIRGAVDYLVQFAVDGVPWPHQDLEPFSYCTLLHDLFVRAAMVWSNATYAAWASSMCNGTVAGNVLWWPYVAPASS